MTSTGLRDRAEDTMEEFLERAEKLGVIDFHLRLLRTPEGKLDFYIHPQNADGETGDFTVSGAFVSKITGHVAAGSSRPTAPTMIASAAPLSHVATSDLDVDWYVVSEAVQDAVTDGEGQIAAANLEETFRHHGLIVRHADALLASPAPAGAEGCETGWLVERGWVATEHVWINAASPAPSPATPPAEARELVEPPHWTDRYQGRPEGAYGWLDDEEVATKVRMLGRSDMDHEAVCTMARDRIAQLSRQVRDLLAALPGAATGKDGK